MLAFCCVSDCLVSALGKRHVLSGFQRGIASLFGGAGKVGAQEACRERRQGELRINTRRNSLE